MLQPGASSGALLGVLLCHGDMLRSVGFSLRLQMSKCRLSSVRTELSESLHYSAVLSE